eukprot:TRINITY_DN21203_c0_g1_i1.p1 TRINITY_DN21203_c0_g1~~TRINITY_DN21203_c0_g1_i1.p1  ORF type:complete len:510 (+),score=130.57 TRINITY_DN21203_c0_g1_i1:41-1570(+)
MALRRTLRRMVRPTSIDWGDDNAVEMRSNLRPASTTKPYSHREGKSNWLTSPANPTDLSAALNNLDTSGPASLQNLLRAKDAPHPLVVFRAIKSKNKRSKISDSALYILLMHCKSLIAGGGKGEYNKARTIFYEALEGGHDVGKSTNTALLICACAAGKPADAEKTLERMKKLKIEILPNVYTALIHVFCKMATDTSKLAKAWEAFEDMVTNAKFNKEDKDGVNTTLALAAASLLNGAARCKSAEDAEKVWKLVVVKWAAKPNVYMYTNYIHALAVSDNLPKALSVFDDMKNAGITPTHHTYASILSALGEEPDDAEFAESLMEEMLENKLVPNIIVYTSLLKVYQKVSDVVGMKSVYRRLRKAQLLPTDHTWGVIVKACKVLSRNRDDSYARLAAAVWDKAKNGLATTKHGAARNPSIHLMLPVLRMFAENLEAHLVRDVVQHLHATKMLFTSRTYGPAMEALRVVDATDLLEQYEAESKQKHQAYQERLQNSTRPRDAAARAHIRDA